MSSQFEIRRYRFSTSRRLSITPADGDVVWDKDEGKWYRGLGGVWIEVQEAEGFLEACDIAGGTNVNVVTPVAIPFGDSQFDPACYSHPVATDFVFGISNSYYVSYAVTVDGTNAARRTIVCEATLNGTPMSNSQSSGYLRNTNDDKLTCSRGFGPRYYSAGDILRITGRREGTGGSALTVAGWSGVSIFKVG